MNASDLDAGLIRLLQETYPDAVSIRSGDLFITTLDLRQQVGTGFERGRPVWVVQSENERGRKAKPFLTTSLAALERYLADEATTHWRAVRSLRPLSEGIVDRPLPAGFRRAPGRPYVLEWEEGGREQFAEPLGVLLPPGALAHLLRFPFADVLAAFRHPEGWPVFGGPAAAG